MGTRLAFHGWGVAGPVAPNSGIRARGFLASAAGSAAFGGWVPSAMGVPLPAAWGVSAEGAGVALGKPFTHPSETTTLEKRPSETAVLNSL